MLARTEDPSAISENWLIQFEAAIRGGDDGLIDDLFHEESYWRDVLAFTWQIGTVNGRAGILGQMKENIRHVSPKNFTTSHGRTPPRNVNRAGTQAIEAIFKFDTAVGQGWGVLRLTGDADSTGIYRAWTLLTALDDLSGGFIVLDSGQGNLGLELWTV